MLGCPALAVLVAGFCRASWLIAGLRRRRRARAELAARLATETRGLKLQLRSRLSEQPQLFEDHLNGAPTLGASLVFERDIEAAAATVLREAGGQRAKAKQLLRQRLSGGGAAGNGKLNGSEAGYWRQLGALSLLDGISDAVAAYARAAELAPDDPDAQMLLGVLHLRNGNLEAAEAAFRHQVELGMGTVQCAAARYRGYTMLGDVYAARHAHDDALAAYAQAQREVKALVERKPEQAQWRRDLSVTHDRIGDMHDGQRRPRWCALQLPRGTCHRRGPGPQRRARTARCGSTISPSATTASAMCWRRRAIAMAHWRASATGWRSARCWRNSADAANAGWQWDLSVSYARVGDLLLAGGDTGQALASYRRGLEIAETLAKRDPATPAGSATWR